MPLKILIICTGNSCRSQMAEGFLRSFDSSMDVHSAGTRPEKEINPFAVRVMAELGIDISKQFPKKLDDYLDKDFDYVITVCDNAKETCPVFTGNVRHRIHIGFEDPADAKGEENEVLNVYREVRDKIRREFIKLFENL